MFPFFNSIKFEKGDKTSTTPTRKDFKSPYDYLRYLKGIDYSFGKWRMMNINPDVVDAILELKEEIDGIKQSIKQEDLNP